jgi:alkaline phosphatase D
LHKELTLMKPLSSRRQWMAQTLALAGVGLSAAAAANTVFTSDPFTLGVASGWPTEQGAVIWTRLAPQPMQDNAGLDPVAITVRWELTEEGATSPVQSGAVDALPQWAHSVRVELKGLKPHRIYRYRFLCAGAVSPQGRFRTAPAADQAQSLRLVFASCQQYEQGYFGAWRHAVADSPDLVAFLGDYIYESSWGRNHVRKHDAGVPQTLEAYRRRHALYRGDADLQAAHAACAWLPTWDDHEVENDYANDLSERGTPSDRFLLRRAAAYQAYFEHMPLPWSMAPKGPSMPIFGTLDWGSMVRLHLIDIRQYRSPQACSAPGFAGSRVVGNDCLALADPSRTLLGAEQEAWLTRAFVSSKARWNLLAQQTLISRADMKPGPEQAWWTDGWDGYPLARRRLLETVRGSGAANPIALGGDVHIFYAGELHEDPDRPGDKPAMVEFVGGSITSQARAQSRIDSMLGENPQLKYGEGRFRGYGLMQIDSGRARVTMRGIDDPSKLDTGVRDLRSFEVRDGIGRLEG